MISSEAWSHPESVFFDRNSPHFAFDQFPAPHGQPLLLPTLSLLVDIGSDSMFKHPLPPEQLNSPPSYDDLLGGNQEIPPLTLECHSQGFTGRDQILTENGTTTM